MSRSNIINLTLVMLIALTAVVGYFEEYGVKDNLTKARNMLVKKQYRYARQEINSVITSNQANSSVYLQAISLLSDAGRVKDAIHIGERFRARLQSSCLDRQLLPMEKAAFYADMGYLYSKTKNINKAECCYNLALSFLPDDPQILNELGYLYADNGIKLDQALKLLHHAVYLCPNNPLIVDSLGWAQYKHGDYKSAISNLSYAVSLAPDNPDLRYHLGAAFLRNGHYLKARIELSKTLSLDTHATIASRLIKNIHNQDY